MIQFQQSLITGVNACFAVLGFLLCGVGALCVLSLLCAAISGAAKLLDKCIKGDE